MGDDIDTNAISTFNTIISNENNSLCSDNNYICIHIKCKSEAPLLVSKSSLRSQISVSFPEPLENRCSADKISR